MKNQDREKLKKIARDISDNLIFTSIGVPENYIARIFMILNFMDKESLKEIEGAVMFYEYYSEQSGLCVNGYPTFFSLYALSKDDAEEVISMVRKLENAIENALK